MDLEGVNYINVCKEDGEIITSVPLKEGEDEVICINGYTVVFGYGDSEFEFIENETKDGKLEKCYSVAEKEIELEKE